MPWADTSSNSRGSRDLAATTTQRLSDNISQASSAVRELRSTVVVHATQAEHQAIETRTVVNYNHSHALTILYYEVLRHYRVVTALARRRPVVLVRLNTDWFAGVDAAAVAVRHRRVLRSALLDSSLTGHFEAAERKLHRQQTAAAVPLPPPAALADRELVHITFAIRTGGVSANLSNDDERVEIRGGLIGPGGSFPLVNRVQGDIDTLGYPGAFTANDHTYIFTAGVKAPPGRVARRLIDAIALGIGPESCDVGIQRITIVGRDSVGLDHELLDLDYRARGGDLYISQPTSILLPLNPAPTAAPPASIDPEIASDDARVNELVEHLRAHPLHYARAILAGMVPAQRDAWLAQVKLPDGTTAADHVENRVLEFVGPWVAFGCLTSSWSAEVIRQLHDPAPDPEIEQLVTLPTRGVFAEAKLGHCNASEEIDNTRFWDWQTSPIPHLAPDIAPIVAVTPQPQTPDLTPSRSRTRWSTSSTRPARRTRPDWRPP